MFYYHISAHSLLDDSDEVGLKEHTEDTRYIKQIRTKWNPKHWECGQRTWFPALPLLGTADLGTGRIFAPWRILEGGEIHTQEHQPTSGLLVVWRSQSKDFYDMQGEGCPRVLLRHAGWGVSTSTQGEGCPRVLKVRGVHEYSRWGVSTSTQGEGCPRVLKVRGVHEYSGWGVSTSTQGEGCPRVLKVRGVHEYSYDMQGEGCPRVLLRHAGWGVSTSTQGEGCPRVLKVRGVHEYSYDMQGEGCPRVLLRHAEWGVSTSTQGEGCPRVLFY